MGLDMYLTKKTYIKNWEHMNPEARTQVSITRNGAPLAGFKPERAEYVIEGMAYWRKANQIHKWFVDHCGDGERDHDVSVSSNDLRDLVSTCKEVLKASKLVKGKIQNGSTYEKGKWVPIMEDGKYVKDPSKAIELLPTDHGFFFGSTEYDQYYIDDIKSTVEQLESILAEPDAEKHDYTYDSSY